MAFVDGSSLPVDQLDHVVSILFNNHCSAQQWVDGWSQANNSSSSQRPARASCSNSACGEAILDQRNRNLYYYYIASQSRLMFKNLFGNQLQKRKELLYNLGAISSYTSMLIFLWHSIEMLVTKEQPKHTLLLYAGSSFFSILVMAPYKWDKKWMRIKTSVGMVVFGFSFIIYLICLWIN